MCTSLNPLWGTSCGFQKANFDSQDSLPLKFLKFLFLSKTGLHEQVKTLLYKCTSKTSTSVLKRAKLICTQTLLPVVVAVGAPSMVPRSILVAPRCILVTPRCI
jgi:hypothetical protein